MKTIRVFALPSHLTRERMSGVDLVRIVQPMQFLNGYSDGEVTFETKVWEYSDVGKTDWQKVAEEYDIIFLNYIANAWAFAAMGLMARKHGRKIVFDLDDALWNIQLDNSAYIAYKPGGENIRNLSCICDEVDLVTTTNKYLRNVIARNTNKTTDKIKVLPNYIDLDLYNHRCKFKDALDIQLLHFGSTTHFLDLENKEFEKGIDMLMKEYPNLTLKTVGAFLPKYKRMWGERYINGYGDPDVYTWIKDKFPSVMDEADILVTPLEENVYTRSKSSIKFIEGSSAGKPGVWQDIRQYREVIDGTNGLLASTADQWYSQIKKLIEDKELRRKMGKAAFKTVKDNWQISSHVKDYAEMFKSLTSS